VLRQTLRALRQPRYVALSVAMVVVAVGCIAAGTWQIARFDQKVRENDALRANDHAAAVAVGDVLPLVGAGSPDADSIRLRTVTATGRYDVPAQRFVRLRNVGGHEGFYVLTPLHTSGGVLLVVRGFVAQQSSGNPPASVTAPPSGSVTLHGRVQAAESGADQPAGIPAGQLRTVNPASQAARLGAPVYDGYITLVAGTPGTSGLTAIPAPSLSNPAGGAVEPQHFAYIIQWYLFALLALAAPVVMARAEQRERRRDDGVVSVEPADVVAQGEPATPEPASAEQTDRDRRAAKLADRYGRAVR
jgi:cytochrome oxidase assembly protein ShyY1